jgi:NADH-quinone oxidoreductase subunit L
MEDKSLLAIVLFPLAGAVALGFFGGRASRQTVHWIACLSVGAAFALAVRSFVQLVGMHEGPDGPNVALSYTAYEWFSLTIGRRTLPIEVRFVMDALSGVMTLVVTGIGFLIHVYSCGYMSEEKSYARFFAYLNLFTASMLILVLGSNLPLMFVGWEGVGLCSYLLIGFWWENRDYAVAGRKAFVANRIGDFGVLLGMFLLALHLGSFEFAEINAQASRLVRPLAVGDLEIGGLTVATAAALLLFLGCAGKSAQIPLYVWLPDAMAGPTPVSALIHAATMVTSGLYLVCRMSPVFAASPAAMAVIAVIGTLTALLAATIGCVQNHIKRVLAYSTVSQLGFMFAAAGCGAFAASFFHVYTHAFFKACLFLGAGSVMHAVGAHGDADVRRLGGLVRWLPRTHLTFLVSCAAIAGVPFCSGFFSKDEILVGALSAGEMFSFAPKLGYVIFAGLVLAATMTAFYMFRLYFLTFWGQYRGGPEHAKGDHGHGHAHTEPHESPALMTVPLVILAVGAFGAGYVWIGAVHFAPWVRWLDPAIVSLGDEHSGTVIFSAMAGGVLALLLGGGLAMRWYFRPGSGVPATLAASYPGVHRFLLDKWRVDELYDATILAGSRALGRVCAGVDKVVVDGLVTNVTSGLVRGVGFLFTRLQNGMVHAYGTVMVAGLLGVAAWFVVPHAPVEASSASGTNVELAAGAGLGYAYRWDFDSDGEFETEWGPESKVRHSYANDQLDDGIFVVVIEPAFYGAARRFEEHAVGDAWRANTSELGANWLRDGGDGTPPRFEVTRRGVQVHPNGARVRKDGQNVDGAIVLARGDRVDVGQARITVTGRARPTVRVRNAFGVERDRTLAVYVPAIEDRPAVEIVAAGRVGGGEEGGE